MADDYLSLHRMNNKELKQFRKQIQEDYKKVFEEIKKTISAVNEMKDAASQIKYNSSILDQYKDHYVKLKRMKHNLENLLFKINQIFVKRNVTPDWAHEGF